MSTAPLPFVTRLWFAWLAFFRILLDGVFAARVWAARELGPAEKEAPKALPTKTQPEPEPAPKREEKKPDFTSALQLLALLQREGRFIDFIQQDIAGFSDADVGTAARVVHEGCRKALAGHMSIEAIRSEEEESAVTIEAGFDAAAVKLSGDVKGSPPFKGKLRHKGWRAKDVRLPTPVEGHDGSVLAPAEVEL